MAAFFDNLDDVQGKFGNTICYYDKKPCLVKGGHKDPEVPGGFVLTIAHPGGRNKVIKLNDPAFNYTEYQLGYVNHQNYAIWWYRKPLKQYQQGLRNSQMGYVFNQPMLAHFEFGMSKCCIAALENIYPTAEQCRKTLAGGGAKSMAFHSDFAFSWDKLHEDCVLEYRGKQVGVSINEKLTKYRLVSEFKHLHEALEEAISGV